MSVSILDPAKLDLNILGCRVEGFSKGSFVTINRESPTFGVRTSLRGSKLATSNKHSNYTLSFRLDNTASANTWLHSIYKLQLAYGIVFPVPVLYKDRNGSTSFFCTTGLLEEPSVDQGDSVNPTEWTITCPKVMNTIGGNTLDSTVASILKTISIAVSAAQFANIDVGGLVDQAQSIRNNLASTIGGLF